MAENIQEYKCPCCGGGITFDSTLQKMKCPYCDTEFEMETLLQFDESLKNEVSEDDLKWQQNQNEWRDGEADGLRYYICKSCGGEIIGDETLAATSCPYCNNPVVMMGQYTGKLKPDYVLPFKLTKEDAEKALTKHLSDKKFLPPEFRDENHIKEVKGIYVPFWLFDADAKASMRMRGTRTSFWSDANYNYTKTSHYLVTRNGGLGFRGVPVDGSQKMADDLMESIEPYDYSALTDFQTAYLSGFFADRYDVDSYSSIERANERIKNSTAAAIRSTVQGYNTLNVENCSVTTDNGDAKYALMPVWLLSTRWNDENYLFAMNGQTGKFVGNLPYDKTLGNRFFWKNFLITALISLAVTSIGFFLLR